MPEKAQTVIPQQQEPQQQEVRTQFMAAVQAKLSEPADSPPVSVTDGQVTVNGVANDKNVSELELAPKAEPNPKPTTTSMVCSSEMCQTLLSQLALVLCSASFTIHNCKLSAQHCMTASHTFSHFICRLSLQNLAVLALLHRCWTVNHRLQWQSPA